MKKYLLVILILIIYLTNLKSVWGDDWDNFRKGEFVLFTGRSIDQFISLPVDHIFVYVYRDPDNSWHQIPFQIDERDDDKGYFENSYNAIVDSADEFLFIAGDGGDLAPPSSWVDDADSKQYIRYEIEMKDPADPTNKKYVYFYVSSVLTHDPNLPYYLDYIPPTSAHSDTIKTAAYIEGHNKKGVPDAWMIADSSGVFSVDILDRQKARAKGKYKPLPFITVSYKLNENDLTVDKRQVKVGRIRIIRNMTYKSEVSGFEIKVGTFGYRYYPDRIISEGSNKKLESSYGVQLIRQSFDMNENAIGSLFNNIDNFDLLIDGVADSVNEVFYPSPVMNWSMHSGNHGTVVILNEFTPPSNASYKTYYHESLTNTTGDGTNDTGDDKSYGDVGILLTGSKINGRISIPYQNYFIPGAQPREVGSTLAYQAQNKLARRHSTQNFAAPSQLAVAFPDTSGPAQVPIAIPIFVGDVTGLNIRAAELSAQYDTLVLQATGINVVGSLTENWNPPAVTITDDTIFIVMDGASALQDSGALIYINFNVVGSQGQQSPLHVVRAKFNTWNPLALTTDGSFLTLAPPKPPVSIADMTMKSGEPLHIPVMISSLVGLELNSYRMYLSYNPSVLEFKGYDITSTIASGWGSPSVQYIPGNLSITSGGTVPLQKAGALIYLDFMVIGPDGSSTKIHFSTMTFNSGKIEAATQDGTVFVRGIVPVELSSFFVTILDKDVKLEWTTATESNNFGFFIQRTTGLAADWQTMGFVQGKGTTTIPQKYSFIDADVPTGLLYYRLQQQDFDGQVNYSEIVEVNLLPNKFALHQNYPNPFNSSTTIKYELPAGQHPVRLIIYDLLGHQVRSLVDEDHQQAGVYQINWDGRDDAGKAVASGVYFYRLQTGKQIFIKKMVLIE